SADGVTLAGLIETLSRLDGVERVRYTTSHPRDMGEDLIAAHRDNPTLMPFLHLPVQSGSDRVLKALIREVNFAQAFSFKYSPRPGTPASVAKIQVPEAVKDERLYALQALLREQQDGFNASCETRVFPVLFEKQGRRAGQAIGRSPYLQAVYAEEAMHLIGKIANVRIEEAMPNSLRGSLVE